MSRIQFTGLLLSLVLVIGWAPVAHAKDVHVILGPVSVGTGSVTCSALNKGKRSIETIVVRIFAGTHTYPEACYDVAPSAGAYSICSRSVSGADEYWCRVEITGGSPKSVVSRLSVEDAEGNTMLILGGE